nr:MAG TPA: hypothetical protein [Caudoviricetes sp.]DAK50012.1 MAG TPA: hypothetical protein [Caudoviricetes sp.]DAW54679.1 MAG TPA: hypothetical protein [Caudoviricetes sp.]
MSIVSPFRVLLYRHILIGFSKLLKMWSEPRSFS